MWYLRTLFASSALNERLEVFIWVMKWSVGLAMGIPEESEAWEACFCRSYVLSLTWRAGCRSWAGFHLCAPNSLGV
jgi:hypothetical protein